MMERPDPRIPERSVQNAALAFVVTFVLIAAIAIVFWMNANSQKTTSTPSDILPASRGPVTPGSEQVPLKVPAR